MKLSIHVKKLHDKEQNEEQPIEDYKESLDLVERLRLEAGKFVYEYPTAFRRVIKVIRKEQR